MFYAADATVEDVDVFKKRVISKRDADVFLVQINAGDLVIKIHADVFLIKRTLTCLGKNTRRRLLVLKKLID